MTTVTSVIDHRSPAVAGPRVPPLGGARWPLGFLVLSVGTAYHYSLLTLARTLDLDTPLAYLGLVPLIAVAVGTSRASAPVDEPDIHDRQLDLIVAGLLLGAALAVATILPGRLTTQFWVWRLDLLSLPLFAAGAVCLLFGTRMMWRLRAAIALLLLAWPVPYLKVLRFALDIGTELTSRAVAAIVGPTGLATAITASGDVILAVAGPHCAFHLAVASQCAGVNSVVGFLLVGAGFAAVATGSRRRKALWLLAGGTLVWSLNLARILVIVAAGRQWGERTAVDVVHPYLGLVTFTVATVLMALSAPAFGIQLPRSSAARQRPVRRGGRKALVALSVVTALAAVSNAAMASFDPLADELGRPRVRSFAAAPPALDGWTTTLYEQYTHGRQYFGPTSTWDRYLYLGPSSTPAADAAPTPSAPVILDVIASPDRRRLLSYGLEECYRFHAYRFLDRHKVALPNRITGELITYRQPRTGRVWTTLHWVWPVAAAGGVRYERVVLMLVDAGQSVLAGIDGTAAQAGRHDWTALGSYLEGIADRMIEDQVRSPEPTT